jgi:hypothetical protein
MAIYSKNVAVFSLFNDIKYWCILFIKWKGLLPSTLSTIVFATAAGVEIGVA